MINSLFIKRNFKNITLNPFSYIKPSLTNIYLGMGILLIPQIIMLFISKSIMSLWIVLAAVVASISADLFYSLIVKNYNFELIAATIHGVITGLLLPAGYPLYGVFLVTFFALMFSKYAFGGFYNSWINPVAFVIAVAYFLNSSAFPQYLVNAADLQNRNAALALIQNETFATLPFDSAVTAFLNKTVFKIFGLSIPDGYVSMFWDCKSIIPAFRFNLITLISSIILISLEMIDVIIPFTFVTVYALLVRFLGPVVVSGVPFQGDILLALLTSGTLFSTIYLLQWYGTTPITNTGKFIYAIIAALVAFLLMGCGTSPTGYIFMVLIMNVISPIIEIVESKQVKHKIIKILIPHIKAMREV